MLDSIKIYHSLFQIISFFISMNAHDVWISVEDRNAAAAKYTKGKLKECIIVVASNLVTVDTVSPEKMRIDLIHVFFRYAFSSAVEKM